MAYCPIRDYGAIGDMHSAALVSIDGSIDWLCFPRFDSPSVFAAILDDAKGGRFEICPTGEFENSQAYLEGTNILVTRFVTPSGAATITDFMPMERDPEDCPHEVVRIVRFESGRIEMRLRFEPRLDYARAETELEVNGQVAVARAGDDCLTLNSSIELAQADGAATAEFDLGPGEEAHFYLHWQDEDPPGIKEYNAGERFEHTKAFWHAVCRDASFDGRWWEVVQRSMLAMHLLIYVPSGAICAAATTSLPEEIGGVRNWDYRFAWPRDAAFTCDIFNRLGHTTYTLPFMKWLSKRICDRDDGHEMHSLYAIASDSDEHSIDEAELEHLEGYCGSKPVRIGNEAYQQRQLDVMGEILVALESYQRAGGRMDDDLWAMAETLVEMAIEYWQEPDLGIWEFRTEPRHFTFSKVMCWAAVDRGLKLAKRLGKKVDVQGWKSTQDAIKECVLSEGWNEEIGSFTQYLGGRSLDASLLFIPMIGFLPGDDPRVGSTIDVIWRELGEDGLLRRYIPEQADDGLAGDEGSFTMCTLWLAGALISAGRVEEAQGLLEKILSMGNHVGLYSEMFDPRTGDYLGNYPQAFTHIALIHTIRNLDRALG